MKETDFLNKLHNSCGKLKFCTNKYLQKIFLRLNLNLNLDSNFNFNFNFNFRVRTKVCKGVGWVC